MTKQIFKIVNPGIMGGLALLPLPFFLLKTENLFYFLTQVNEIAQSDRYFCTRINQTFQYELS